MAKIALRLDTRREKADGTFPLKVSVHRDKRTIYLPLDISLRAGEWDKSRQEIVKRPDRKTLNVILREKLALLNAELLKIQLAGRLRTMSDAQLYDALTGGDSTPAPLLVKDFSERFIENIPNRRTRKIYAETVARLKKFAPDFARLAFTDITPSWLKEFDAHMVAAGNKVNTRSIHLRNLRALFNAALNDELITCYPFRRFKIKSQMTAKRALTKEQMLALWHAEVAPHRRKYIDMFFLGFFLIGINVVDMAQLTAVENGRIAYERAKTHKLYSIKVEKEAQEIIDRYRGKEKLLSFFDGVKNYRSIANRQNNNLSVIAALLEIGNLTYYCCRHTWATFAAEIDIPDDVIAIALGHTRATVTDVYIRRNRSKVDEANRAVIDYLFK